MSPENPETLTNLVGDAERRAAARSRAHQFFAEALEYPDEALCEAVRSGAFADELRATLERVDPRLAEDLDRRALSDAGEHDALAVEYTRLFDAGTGGPPCPLYGGLYAGARMKVMEEAVRFYNFFGLHLSSAPRELPDHLTTQLEFLHYLAYREASALQQEQDADPFRRAQRDFLERHPGLWVPRLRERLERQKPLRFFAALFASLERFLAHERDSLVAEVGPVPPPDTRSGG